MTTLDQGESLEQNDLENQEEPDNSQSNQESEKPQNDSEMFFTDSFGNKYNAEDFQAKFNEVQSNFGKIAQENASFRKESEASKKQAEAQARESVGENDGLKDVDPDIKEAIIKIMTPVLEEREKQKAEELKQAEEDRQFLTRLDQLEKEFPGGNGQPKFDRQTVLSEMQKPENKIFDPEVLYYHLNRAKFQELAIKEALEKNNGSPSTENTGSSTSKPNSNTSANSWEEAAKRASARF